MSKRYPYNAKSCIDLNQIKATYFLPREHIIMRLDVVPLLNYKRSRIRLLTVCYSFLGPIYLPGPQFDC
jgi:hypothetical protein